MQNNVTDIVASAGTIYTSKTSLVPLLIPISPLFLPEHLPPPLLDRLSDTKIIKQPLIRMSPVVPEILIPPTLDTIASAPLIDPRLAELSDGNFHALSARFGPGHSGRDEVRPGAGHSGHGGRLGELGELEGGGSGSSGSAWHGGGASSGVIGGFGVVGDLGESCGQVSGVDGGGVVVCHRQ